MRSDSQIAHFRFYEELNVFLPPRCRKVEFDYSFSGRPSLKDAIESLGVPHPEVDLILVNGLSVGFEQRLQDGDRVSVYPVFEALDISGVTRLRPAPLRNPRFILDVHLGRLARLLRLAGFDTLYSNDQADLAIIDTAAVEGRIILTRDIGLLKHGQVSRGYWIRHQKPAAQLAEVIEKFDLSSKLQPFTRCLECNFPVETVSKEEVLDALPPRVRERQEFFIRCPGCGRIYWPGTHYQSMRERLAGVAGLRPGDSSSPAGNDGLSPADAGMHPGGEFP